MGAGAAGGKGGKEWGRRAMRKVRRKGGTTLRSRRRVEAEGKGVVVISFTTVERTLPSVFAALPPSASKTHLSFISGERKGK